MAIATEMDGCRARASQSGSGGSLSSSLVHLRRSITLFSGICINVGIIIGSGIFVSPKGVLQGAGSLGLTLVVWGACGLFSLLGALCFAELGTTFPSSGAVYAYLKAIYGDLVAFVYLWISVLMATPAFFGIVALTFGDYCLQPLYPDPQCPPPRLVVQLLGTAAMVLLGLVNVVSIRLSTLLQNLFTVCKVFALVIIIIAGLVQLIKGQTQNFENSFEGSTFSGLGFALYAGLFSFTGWESLNYVAEELKKPNKNLPRATFVSVTVVTILYVFTNVAYFTAMTPAELLASNAVAVTFGDKLLGGFALLMPIFVALSTFGAINGNIMVCSRMIFVGGRGGQFPSVLSMIHINFLSPVPAIIVIIALSICYTFSNDIYTLINFFSYVAWTSIGAAVAGMVWKRWREPDRPRPYKVNIIVPILFVVAAIFVVVMGTIDSPRDTAIGVGITLTGIPVYFLFVYPKRLPGWLTKLEVLLGLVNVVSIRLSTLLQNLFTVCKVFALVIIIIAGLVQLIKGQTQNFENSFEGSTFSGLGFALYAGLFSFTGWESLNYVAEELKKPNKNLPRATFVSVTVVTILYVFTNVAYFTAMTPAELLASNAVAVTFGDKLLGGFALLMPIFVALSTFGAINGNIMVCSRMIFVGGRGGQFPSVLSMIHINFLSPVPAIIVIIALSICYTFSNDIYTLINFFSYVAWTSIGAAVAGMVWKRWREPDRPRPYKVNIIVPILFVVAAIFVVVMGTIDSPRDTAIGVGITLTGIPVYFLFVYPKRLPGWLTKLEGRVTRFVQMLLLVVEEETK